MIYIFSAFYAEAKNIIDHYGLKKEKSPEMVRFDVFANDSIRLVITGVGEINAAASISYTTESHPSLSTLATVTISHSLKFAFISISG